MTVLLKTYRSPLLLCAFIAQLLLSPLADSHPYVGGALALSLLLILLGGATYMGNQRTVRSVVLPLAALWLAARMLEAFGDSRYVFTHLAPVAGLALSLVVLGAILNRLSSLSRVTSGVIAEAFIGYLVIASAFSQVYWILNRIVVNPFNQPIPNAHISTLLYFSLITLSTVGYGGIAPVNSYVRLIAALESVIGLFYMAVVVARLVSSYSSMSRLSHSRRPAAPRRGVESCMPVLAPAHAQANRN